MYLGPTTPLSARRGDLQKAGSRRRARPRSHQLIRVTHIHVHIGVCTYMYVYIYIHVEIQMDFPWVKTGGFKSDGYYESYLLAERNDVRGVSRSDVSLRKWSLS